MPNCGWCRIGLCLAGVGIGDEDDDWTGRCKGALLLGGGGLGRGEDRVGSTGWVSWVRARLACTTLTPDSFELESVGEEEVLVGGEVMFDVAPLMAKKKMTTTPGMSLRHDCWRLLLWVRLIPLTSTLDPYALGDRGDAAAAAAEEDDDGDPFDAAPPKKLSLRRSVRAISGGGEEGLCETRLVALTSSPCSCRAGHRR